MTTGLSRRFVLSAGAACALAPLHIAQAQSKPKMRFSCAFAETDLRAEGFKAFAAAMKDDFDFEPYWFNSLFKQGTELVALQRNNLELCNLAPADISKQVPAWSLMTSAYLFRDYAHLDRTFQSEVGQDFIKMARDQLDIEVICPVYFGSRNVNLRSKKKVNTPADLAGTKLRMPPGEFWQFLGESIGVNPTPVAFSELYTALQSGAVDGQDNPAVLTRNQKFYEVTSQYILTAHVVAFDVFVASGKAWKALSSAQQDKVRTTATRIFNDNAKKHIALETDALEFFKKQGLEVYAPDQGAFRTFAQKRYVDRYGKDWPKGALEKINALGDKGA